MVRLGQCLAVPISAVLLAWLLPASADMTQPTGAKMEANGLSCQFEVERTRVKSSDELRAQAIFKNTSGGRVRLNALYLHIPQVLIKARTSDGKPVHPGLPPLPPADDGETGRIDLAPGEEVRFSYQGSDYFGSPLARGKYQARFVYENVVAKSGEWLGKLETDWVDFQIVP